MDSLLFDDKAIELVKGDITKQKVDAIGNAANAELRGGGGVDGAIHSAGGPSIMEECRRIGSCPTGSAVLTSAGDLQARYVIHAVGPVFGGGLSDEAELLASAYSNSLRIAAEHKLESIAFPSISTGVYGYPLDQAAPIALSTVVAFLHSHTHPKTVRFVLFDSTTYDAYSAALANLRD